LAFLDLRTSQGPKNTPVSTNAASPDYITGIGLIVGSAANIQVDMNATVGVSGGTNTFIISVVRHNNPVDIGIFSAGTVIYSQSFDLTAPVTVSAAAFSLSTADLPPTPPSGQLTYGVFASALFTGAAYQGTQNLIGKAVSI
jgi:hypothetical protein